MSSDIKINRGLKGIYFERSCISDIDSANGRLTYRGYQISDLAKNSTFEEVCYLLIYGNLPNHKELNSFQKKVLKLNIITGKGLRSKVDKNPYQSKDLGILKYSVPEFIKSNTELMKIIKKIDDQVDNKNSGFFSVLLKL